MGDLELVQYFFYHLSAKFCSVIADQVGWRAMPQTPFVNNLRGHSRCSFVGNFHHLGELCERVGQAEDVGRLAFFVNERSEEIAMHAFRGRCGLRERR